MENVVVACEPLREVLSLLGPIPARVVPVDGRFHRSPALLREHLQGIIDEHGGAHVTLAMGLCGEATVGLKASRATLAVPRVDDCLALLLGSQAAYRERARTCPGTYYFTKGWLESGEDIVSDFQRGVERYGEERAVRGFRGLLRNYRQVVFIEFGLAGEEPLARRAAAFAERFGLAFHHVRGDLSLLGDVVFGRQGPGVIRIPVGGRTAMSDFLDGGAASPAVERRGAGR